MKEMCEHAAEIQTNTAMFASQIHRERRGTVNTDTQANPPEDQGSLTAHRPGQRQLQNSPDRRKPPARV